MAAASSFDVTSSVDLQEVDNAVNQARKEIAQRYDFKGSMAAIDFSKTENTLTLVADDNMKMDALWDILQTRLVRRNVPVKNLKLGDVEAATGSTVRRVITLQQGIPADAAREIIKYLKDQKLKKVQASIQGDQLRISSASKDELQDVIRLLRAQRFRHRPSVRQLPITPARVLFQHKLLSTRDDLLSCYQSDSPRDTNRDNDFVRMWHSFCSVSGRISVHTAPLSR